MASSMLGGATPSGLFKRQSDNPQDDQSNSASSIVTVLVVSGAYAGAYFILFLFFRSRFKRYYEPRTFLGSLRKEQRTPKVSDSLFGWIGDFYRIPDTYVLQHQSMDAYLFLRFLRVSVMCCFVGCLITWPVLFPVNATGGNGEKQFNILSMTNVKNKWRYFAHAGVAIIYFGFIIYTITRESVFYINLRQAYLMSPLYASRVSSRTVLYTSVPEDYMHEGKLRAMLGSGVRRVWFATDTKKLDKKVEERDTAALKLEGAETKLLVSANGARLKAAKKGGRSGSEEAAIGEGTTAMKYLKPKQRPTHRLKMLIGKKVDTIDWCRAELKKLIPEVDQMQAAQKAGDSKKLNSVFVEFTTVSEAQSAYQSLAHHQALHMAPRYAGVNPGEVIWSNLRIKWWERVIRHIFALSFVVALVIFWSIPVAAVGAISNINALEDTKNFTWLHSIFDPIPKVIMGVVTGLLPTILLAVLMALLPIILRFMAKFSGDPTTSAVELTVQNYYFAFQIIQCFLVATLGSAASSVAGTIAKNPGSAVTLLAQNLPKASNFYLSYFLLQGLGVVASVLLGLTGLALFFILGKLLDKTPRKMYQRWISLSGLGWGTVFPIYTNLFVIAICYAAIAPLVLGFATIGLYLFYVAYRYNLLFVANDDTDTKGRIYPRALQQLFVGLYVAELCLVGLFAISTGKSKGAIGPLVLMILMVVFTALYQVSLNSALNPLIEYLPKSVDAEERRLQAIERGEQPVNDQKYEDGAVAKEGASSSAPAANGHVPPPHKKPNFLAKWLRPDIYQDYATLRRLVPKDVSVEYTPEQEVNAYFNPSVTAEVPLLWIPRDPVGMSAHEIRETNPVIPITDEAAYLNDKNKIVWDAQDARPPIYSEEPYF